MTAPVELVIGKPRGEWGLKERARASVIAGGAMAALMGGLGVFCWWKVSDFTLQNIFVPVYFLWSAGSTLVVALWAWKKSSLPPQTQK